MLKLKPCEPQSLPIEYNEPLIPVLVYVRRESLMIAEYTKNYGKQGPVLGRGSGEFICDGMGGGLCHIQ